MKVPANLGNWRPGGKTKGGGKTIVKIATGIGKAYKAAYNLMADL